MERARVRDAVAADVPAMAQLAEEKRRLYRDNARPFQIPARDAREAHEAFLPKLLAWDGFTVLVHEAGDGIDGFAVARFGAAPPPFGEGSLFHVDDFAVASGELWASAGAELLRALSSRASEAGLEQAIVVSGPASVDPRKVRFLLESGLGPAAEWWVKALTPQEGEHPAEPEGFEALIGAAPPVYDPGGPTCLALRVEHPVALERLEHFASASGAVVAIVPVRVEESALREALRTAGYTVASEWYTAPAAALR